MKQRESGFTIIETTLVLAITGLIVAVILVGIGNALNQQRYIDAVNQAVDFVRGQYTVGANTMNNRPANESCGSGGIRDDITPMPRGASDCLLVGTIMRTQGSDGKTVNVYQVVALADPDESMMGDDDTTILAAANLSQGGLVQTYKADWDTRFLSPDSADPAQFNILVVRTPISGTMRTYSSDSATTSIANLINPAVTPQIDRKLCIDQTGFFGIGVQPMGILISRDTANTTGVQILPSGECVA